MKVKIELGDKVEDRITGIKGTAISNITYLNGCEQFGIQQRANADGSVPQVQWIDVPDLMRIGPEKEKPIVNRTGGGNRSHP